MKRDHDAKPQGAERKQRPAEEEDRRRRGAAPAEDAGDRALEIEPGVEQHAGEDSGALPERNDPE